MAHAMDAGGVLFARFLVATRTGGWRQLAFVDQILDALMAIYAIQGAVNGFVEVVRGKQQRNDIRSHRTRGAGIQMAIQTISVGEFIRGAQCR